ncbi:hypothetical protein D3C71_1017730 [compost metagenome]
MGIVNKLFKWFSVKDQSDKEIQVGFVLEHEPKTTEDIRKVFKAFKLTKYFELIEPLVRPVIKLDLTPQDEPDFGLLQSKVGGRPALGKMQKWPVNDEGIPLSFIAQLNMAEVKSFDVEGRFPENGLLSFFYCSEQDVWGFDPADKDHFKVLFTEDLNDLEIKDFPEDLNPEGVFLPNKIDFETSLNIPDWEDDAIHRLIDEDDYENYSEAGRGFDNQLFGYANAIQGEMELDCQLVTNGLFCGDETGYEDSRRKELEQGKEDWILLLQLDSEEEKTGMLWGDGGRIYFWIKKQDLANKNFDKVWCVLQCY